MPNAELVSAVASVHGRSRAETHYSDPASLASAFIGDPSSPLYEEIQRTTFREPTEPHVFPHVHETVQELLQNGDDIVVWTQGKPKNQLWKVASSGLGRIHHELPKDQRYRITVAADEDKMSILPSLLKQEKKTTIVFVDDKPSMLTAAQQVMEHYPHISAHYIRVNHKIQEVIQVEKTHPFTTITDIADLKTMKEKLQIQESVHWYMDFGNTLVDSDSLRRATDASYAAIVEQREPIITHAIDVLTGLPGHVARIEELTTEDHGKHVVDVTAPNGNELVIKSSDAPEKIRREIEGYKLLEGTPLATHITFPYASSPDPAFLVLPKIKGVQMREGVRKEELDEDTAMHVLQELLDIKKQWWAAQEKQDPEKSGIVSHQRANWSQNLGRITEVINRMSQSTGIPIGAFFSAPLISSGKQLPPLRNSLLLVHSLLEQPPPYTVLTHGDAMGGNILVEKDTGMWHIFDPEYAGYNDPAEAYVKAIKYVTTATSQGIQGFAATYNEDLLTMDVRVKFPPLAYKLQKYGLSRIDEFAQALDDPDFPKRVRTYFTASYLREIALTLRRKKPGMAWFALLQAQKNTAKTTELSDQTIQEE